MADQTLYATLGFTSVIRWVDPSINIDSYITQKTLSVGANTAVPGDIMAAEGETQGYVDIAVETDPAFLGVMLNEIVITDGYDIDEAALDGVTVDILRPTGGRTIIACILNSSAGGAIEEGDYLRVSSAAGHLELFVYANSTYITDNEQIVVGRSAIDTLMSATAQLVTYVWY